MSAEHNGERQSSEWVQISPGMFAREVPIEERVLNLEFVEKVADQIEDERLAALIRSTGNRREMERLVRSEAESRTTSVLERLRRIFHRN